MGVDAKVEAEEIEQDKEVEEEKEAPVGIEVGVMLAMGTRQVERKLGMDLLRAKMLRWRVARMGSVVRRSLM